MAGCGLGGIPAVIIIFFAYFFQKLEFLVLEYDTSNIQPRANEKCLSYTVSGINSEE